MTEDTCRVRWINRQAVMTLPENIDRSNADRVREQLLLVINRGAVALIADLAATLSCDYSGTDALARANQRAVASGTELRIVVTADVVRRLLSLSGLDRLVSVYPTLDAGPCRRSRSPGGPCRASNPGDQPGRARDRRPGPGSSRRSRQPHRGTAGLGHHQHRQRRREPARRH